MKIKLDAVSTLQGIKNKAKEEWDKFYTSKNSYEINHIIKDFETIPHIKNDLKSILDNKESELIKKRNLDLYQIRALEK